jgi:hypothetical protein
VPAEGDEGADGPGREARFDPEFALKFLKWREEKRRGVGRRRGRGRREVSIEEVRDDIMRRIRAIRRHRERYGGGPETGGQGAGPREEGDDGAE